MARNIKRRLAPTGEKVPEALVSDVSTFAKRLHSELQSRNWSQSDLARRVWGEVRKDGRGFDQIVGRDRISAYINKGVQPEPRTLQKIAEVLGVPVADLAPDITLRTVAKEEPALEIRMIAGHADKVLLRVSRLVPLAVAAKVALLLEEVEKEAAKK